MEVKGVVLKNGSQVALLGVNHKLALRREVWK